MFTIRVHMVRSSYEASLDDGVTPEWPPHPARLYGALVDAADLFDPEERLALGRLALMAPPNVVTGRSALSSTRSNYVVTNKLEKGGGSQSYPARSASGQRSWPRTMLAVPEIEFQWATLEGEITPELGAMNRIAKRVPYFGRSTSPVVVEVISHDATNAEVAKTETWRPCVSGDGIPTRVPTLDYLAGLERAFENGQSGHEVPTIEIDYTSQPEATAHDVGSPYDPNLLVKKLSGMHDGRRALELALVVRKAFLAHLGKRVAQAEQPAALCGHANGGETTWHQVMFLPLLFVGSEHADGTVKGIALALPKTLDRKTRLEALAAWRGIDHLMLGSRGRVGLTDAVQDPIASLSSARWSTSSRLWSTVTPIVPERFCTTNAQRISYVHGELRKLELPDAVVRVDLVAQLAGSLVVPAGRLKRSADDKAKPNFHVSIQFEQPVRGPIVLGNMRNFGIGLFLPRPKELLEGQA